MTTQRAIVTSLTGQRAILSSKSIPRPGPKEVLMRVTVAGLNPHDQAIRDRGLFNDLFGGPRPVTLANDITGIVTAVGEGVSKFKIGDSIFNQGDLNPEYTQAGLQEYAISHEDHAAKIPEGFSEDDVTSLPTNIIAAAVGLFDENSGLGITPPWVDEATGFDYAGTTVLIVGGGSNCGRFAVQFAELAGIGRIVVVGGREEQLKAFGATHVIDRHGGHDAVLGRIRDIVGDDLIYTYDAVNYDENQRLGINALSSTKKGTFARLVRYWERDDSILNPKKNGFVMKDVFGSSHTVPYVCVPLWTNLPRYLQEKKIVPLQYEVKEGLHVDGVNEVLDKYRDRKPVVQTHFRISY